MNATGAGQADAVRLLQVLTFWDLVVYGLVYVAPIGPWSTWGFASALSGGAVSLVFLLGALALGFTALSYAQLCAEVPEAGSVYSYARVAIGESAGFIGGWMILLDYLLLPALMYVFCGVALAAYVPVLPGWGWILLVAAYNIGVNWFGIKTSARFNVGTLVFQFVLLFVGLVAALWVMRKSGMPMFTGAAWWGPTTSIGGVLAGTSLCVLAYLGFDAITTLAAEVTPAQRHLVGRAVIFAMGLLGFMAVFNVWILSDLGRGFVSSSGDLTVLTFDVFSERVDADFGQAIALGSALAVAISITPPMVTGVARVLYAMAQKGEMPAFLGRLDARYRVPQNAIAASGALSVAIAIYFASQFDTLTAMVNFGALTAFALVNASVIALFVGRKKSRRYVVHLLLPLLGILIIAGVLTQMSATGIAVGVAWLAAGAVLVAALRARGRRPRSS